MGTRRRWRRDVFFVGPGNRDRGRKNGAVHSDVRGGAGRAGTGFPHAEEDLVACKDENQREQRLAFHQEELAQMRLLQCRKRLELCLPPHRRSPMTQIFSPLPPNLPRRPLRRQGLLQHQRYPRLPGKQYRPGCRLFLATKSTVPSPWTASRF